MLQKGVLCDGSGTKVVSEIDKSGERACGETLDALEGGGGRVCVRIEEEGMGWTGGC